MPTLEPLYDQLTPAEIEIASIFLDPNNPRFVGLQSIFIPDDRVKDPTIQQAALDILEKHFSVDRVRSNMAVNGYLPIDRIVVREIEGGYLVLEGNRRIAAAKTVPQFLEDGSQIDQRVIESLKMIPVLVYAGSDNSAAWLFQGLRHISGINDWSAYNKARLLVEQMQKEGLSVTTAGQRFGISPHGAGQWVRSYHAFIQAREETDYSSEVDEKIYPYVQELFGRSSIYMKDWISWDDNAQKFRNVDLYNEFIGWFYPRAEAESGGEENPNQAKGDWDKKRIGNRDDIRQLSFLIQHAPKHFQSFRGGLEFEAAYGQAMVEQYEKAKEQDTDRAKKVLDVLDLCANSLNNIPLVMVKDNDLNAVLTQKINALKKAIDFVEN